MSAQEPERRLDPRYSIDGDLTNRFTYHAPTPEQPEVYQLIRDLAHLFALVVEAATYPNPERSLAVTKAEEAVMWANAAVARRGLSGAGIAGAGDLLAHALQQLYMAKPGSLVVEGLDVPVPVDEKGDDPWAKDTAVHDATAMVHDIHLRYGVGVLRVPCPACGAQQGDTDNASHPSKWMAVCPFCPAYSVPTDGVQRHAQDWLVDHIQQNHEQGPS